MCFHALLDGLILMSMCGIWATKLKLGGELKGEISGVSAGSGK